MYWKVAHCLHKTIQVLFCTARKSEGVNYNPDQVTLSICLNTHANPFLFPRLFCFKNPRSSNDILMVLSSNLTLALIPDLQRTFFRMKRNFEKKQKNIARAYSKEKKEGEPHLPLLHLPATHLTMR